jgi:hypothetical protein
MLRNKQKKLNLFILIIIPAILLALNLLLHPVWAGLDGEDQERPFKGMLEGRAIASPSAVPYIFVGGTQAAGVETHLGRFTKVTRDTLNILTGELKGAFTMTAANGDILTGDYTGLMYFDSLPVPGGDPVGFSWTLNASIMGGTGRFSNANGSFIFVAEGTGAAGIDGELDGEYTETLLGTITY